MTHPYRWYYGDVTREDAEKWLLIPSNHSGTFLVRTNSTKEGLSLSVREEEGIKHYRISRLNDDGGYFIASRAVFRTLQVRLGFMIVFIGASAASPTW